KARSTMKATSATAVVNAGPQTARQSTCMVSHQDETRAGSLPHSRNSCWILSAVVKAWLLRSSAFRVCWNQMLFKCHGTRVTARAFTLEFFERTSMPTISPTLLPVLMLFASNVFMTFAWYGHLKYKDHSLVLVILASWGIAFFEYWLAVPAN